MSKLIAKEYRSFEETKRISDDGVEFWYARELADVLEYVQWRNFAKVLERAMLACKNSGYEVSDHFAEVSKTIEMPKTATKKVGDYKLSRYACYLIVQNGDPRKEIIALGQTYFAIQTRRQEVIHKKKGLKKNEKILDFMSSTELIANLFRISQTEEKLKKDKTATADEANEIHFLVGKEVRGTIERVGGTMPEDIPVPEKSISEVEKEQLKKLKKSKKKLMLDE